MIQLTPWDRVLIRMPSWLGDFVMAEAAVRALVAQRAHAGVAPGITLAAPGPFLTLLEHRFEGVRTVPLAPRDAGASAADGDPWRGHDVAIFLDGSLRSVWRGIRAGIPVRVGWARGGRGPLLTHSVRPAFERGGLPLGLGRRGRRPRVLPRPFSSVCLELFAAMGIPVPDAEPRLEATAGARAAVRRQVVADGVEAGEPFLLLNAGARPGSSKGFPPSRWVRVLERFLASHARPVFVIGGPGEGERVRDVVDGVGDARVHAVPDSLGDLVHLAAWCAEARAVLTTDGGVRHVAGAVGSPRVVLFGPTDPRHSTEVSLGESQVRGRVPCGPCHLERCDQTGGAHHACMEGLDQAEVLAALEERWRPATALRAWG